jgi:sarcosine oxidase, subunit beta
MGSSVAYHLAKMGAGSIVLLEKKAPGSGPSGKSHAVLPQYYTLEALGRMTSESWRFYQDFDKITGKESVFHKVGILWGYQESLADKMEKNAVHVRKWGLSPKIIDSDEFREISPNFFIPDWYGAMYDRDGGYVNAQLAVEEFVAAALELGAHVSPYTTAEAIDIQNGKTTAVLTDRGRIETEHVISTAGIWTRSLIQKAGWDLPITNTKTGICMMKRPSDFRGDHEVIVDYVNSCYLRAQGDTVTDVAIWEPHTDAYFDQTKSEDPDDYVDSILDEKIERYIEIGARYPGLQKATVQGTYACVYDNTPDRQPAIGWVPGVQGFLVAVGFSGHGFKMAPMVGRSISELVTKGRSSIDLSILSPERFKKGQLVKYDPLFDDA